VDKIDTDFFIGTGRVNVYKALHLDKNPTLFAVISSPYKNVWIPGGTGTFEIWGTALATGGKYVLEVKPHDSSIWTEVKDGGQTIDGVLGGIKVDSVPPGYYDIRLRAIVGGSEDADQITVKLGGDVE